MSIIANNNKVMLIKDGGATIPLVFGYRPDTDSTAVPDNAGLIHPDRGFWSPTNLGTLQTSTAPGMYLIYAGDQYLNNYRYAHTSGNNCYTTSNPRWAKTTGDGLAIFYKCSFGISATFTSTVSQTLTIIPSSIYCTQTGTAFDAWLPAITINLTASTPYLWTWGKIMSTADFTTVVSGTTRPSHFGQTWVYTPLVSCNYIAGLTVSKIKYGWSFV